MISSNGFGGCTKCLQLGETVLTEKGGLTHIYPFNKQNPTGPARSDESYNDDVNKKYKYLMI